MNTKHAMHVVTVTASGNMLTPFMSFKGKPTGCIAQQEFGTYPNLRTYTCQEKAWMDESKMNEWIDVVIWLWKVHQDANKPSVEPPIIILMRIAYIRCVLLSTASSPWD